MNHDLLLDKTDEVTNTLTQLSNTRGGRPSEKSIMSGVDTYTLWEIHQLYDIPMITLRKRWNSGIHDHRIIYNQRTGERAELRSEQVCCPTCNGKGVVPRTTEAEELEAMVDDWE